MAVSEFGANEYVTRSNVNQRISQINANFPVSVANGGTGQTSLTSGNILLGNGTSGISSTATLPISKGGTGATTVSDALSNLGFEIPVAISHGGTGATSALNAAGNLGLTGTEKTITASTYAQFISQVQSDIGSASVDKIRRVFGGRYYWSGQGESNVIAYYTGNSTAFIIFNKFAGIGTKLYCNMSDGYGWQEAPLSIGSGGTGATTASAARTNLEVMKATTLYQNDSGTSGTITLSETSANFDYIEVYYKTDGDSLTSQKIYSPNGKSAFLYVNTAYSPTNTVMMFMGIIVFSGTSVTWNSNNDAFFAVNTSNAHTFNFQRGLYIYKIVGFSY